MYICTSRIFGPCALFMSQYNGEYEAGGTVMTYERQGDKEILKAPGPLKESLHIMVSSYLTIVNKKYQIMF